MVVVFNFVFIYLYVCLFFLFALFCFHDDLSFLKCNYLKTLRFKFMKNDHFVAVLVIFPS